MSIWRLVFREMAHRRLAFVLAVLSVFIAVGVLVAQMSLLKAHDIHTAEILDRKKAQVEQADSRLKDDYRKIMLELGFNLQILPKDLDLGDFYATGQTDKYMPESYVETLAASQIVTVRHLLPILEQRLTWPERKRKIILVGVRGEVPLLHRKRKQPIMQPVPAGHVVVGFELANSLDIRNGQTIRLLGRDFVVSECLGERGTKDDATVWLNLSEAQQLLGKTGLINAILALECGCAWANVPKVRADIAKVLPGTQVKEVYDKALARAEARYRAARAGAEAIAREADARAQLRQRLEAFALWLVPLVVIAATAWISLLTYTNVRHRRGEIGILRAIGMRSGQLAAMFLARTVIVGVTGAVLGCLAGLIVGIIGGRLAPAAGVSLLDPLVLGAVLVGATVLSVLACWPPAMLAGREDPAVVLQEE